MRSSLFNFPGKPVVSLCWITAVLFLTAAVVSLGQDTLSPFSSGNDFSSPRGRYTPRYPEAGQTPPAPQQYGSSLASPSSTPSPAAIIKQFFTGQFSEEMLQWYTKQTRPSKAETSPAVESLARSGQQRGWVNYEAEAVRSRQLRQDLPSQYTVEQLEQIRQAQLLVAARTAPTDHALPITSALPSSPLPSASSTTPAAPAVLANSAPLTQEAVPSVTSSRPALPSRLPPSRRGVQKTAKTAPPSEYRQMLGRLGFSLSGLGKEEEDYLAPPSNKAVFARFVTGKRNEEMSEWRNNYLELAARQTPTAPDQRQPQRALTAPPAEPLVSGTSRMIAAGNPQPAVSSPEVQAVRPAAAAPLSVRPPVLSAPQQPQDSPVQLVSAVLPKEKIQTASESEESSSGKIKVYRPREPQSEQTPVARVTPLPVEQPSVPAPRPLVVEETDDDQWRPVQ